LYGATSGVVWLRSELRISWVWSKFGSIIEPLPGLAMVDGGLMCSKTFLLLYAPNFQLKLGMQNFEKVLKNTMFTHRVFDLCLGKSCLVSLVNMGGPLPSHSKRGDCRILFCS
jgi:hypothetical protein